MKRIIGNEIWVFLKSSNSPSGDIFGLLIDVTDDSLYVQCLGLDNQEIYIISQNNVKYCTTKYLPTAGRVIAKTIISVPQENINEEKEELKHPECLDVFINDNMVASIPVPPTFNLSVWNDNIVRVILGNPDVKSLLAGKIQKSIEYYPGEVYIQITEEEEEWKEETQDDTILNKQMENQNQNTFVMGGGDAATQFLNPSQMVSRLNSAVRRGKKNGNQTKV